MTSSLRQDHSNIVSLHIHSLPSLHFTLSHTKCIFSPHSKVDGSHIMKNASSFSLPVPLVRNFQLLVILHISNAKVWEYVSGEDREREREGNERMKMSTSVNYNFKCHPI